MPLSEIHQAIVQSKESLQTNHPSIAAGLQSLNKAREALAGTGIDPELTTHLDEAHVAIYGMVNVILPQYMARLDNFLQQYDAGPGIPTASKQAGQEAGRGEVKPQTQPASKSA
jgi:hypothetical protein